ncbi:MAG TPA: metallopeptidase TldD-related protein [Gaiellaceae bacterium]|nr:metallopeptidase TldD-related protein [Gaiellaceae bacterium]
MTSDGRALELAERAWRAAEADEADAVVQAEESGFARFAASEVHQPTLIRDETVTLRVVRDGRVGCAVTNRIDDEGLKEAGRRAAEAADSAPPDPGYPGLQPPAAVPDVAGYDEETAALTAEEQAAAAAGAIEAAPDYGLYGYFTSGVTETAVASSTGHAVSQRMTDASVLAIAATDDSSGYAEATSWRAGELDLAGCAREAAEKAARTRGATEIEPGTHAAILEPYALSELLWYFAFSSLGALSCLEGRSYLSGRLGERLFHESFTLVDDGLDPQGMPKAFDLEGVPKQPVTIVEEGVARDVVWDRRTAKRAGEGRESTGHALPAPAQGFGPIPLNLSVRGGDAAASALPERVGDGIYVTRLHYLGVVDPREGIITGMTRDGTFRIEGGKVTKPLVNLRFTTSFPKLVEGILGLSEEIVLVNRSDFYDERYPFGTRVPAVATSAFTIVGTGSGPGL